MNHKFRIMCRVFKAKRTKDALILPEASEYVDQREVETFELDMGSKDFGLQLENKTKEVAKENGKHLAIKKAFSIEGEEVEVKIKLIV